MTTFVARMNNIEKKEVMKAVGDFLKSTRKNRIEKISQESMARLIGISQVQYSRIENGKGRLSIIELDIICTRLGITLTELAFNIEHYMIWHSLLPPERKQRFRRWLKIYQKYYNYPSASK